MKKYGHILQEILEFSISVVWLGAAFGIAIAGGLIAILDGADFSTPVLQSLVVVFFAFVFHEMAHRILARRYGFGAVYKMWLPGLIMSLIAALVGFIVAAPGGVYLDAKHKPADYARSVGLISLVGPAVNMTLSVVFLGLSLIFRNYLNQALTGNALYPDVLPPPYFIWGVLAAGVRINAWLALFNLIPFGIFDGFKIYAWNKKIWIASFGLALALYILVTVVQGSV